MNAISQLKWSDLVSPTLSPEEYLKTFKKKIKETYESYELKSNVIIQIKELIKSKNEKLKIVTLGADWCPDCTKNVPKMIKIVKVVDDGNVNMKILYGIMVNAFHKPGESLWHRKRSPPEASDPKFDLKAIPTFYFFNKDGNYLGVIIERPKAQFTLEEDILDILEKNL